MKSAFVAALLLFASKASAEDQLRLLRGVNDANPNPDDVERGSTQDLLREEEPPHHQASSTTDAANRQLRGREGIRMHRASPHSNRHKMQGTHPSQGAPRGRTRHAPRSSGPRGGGRSSPHHGGHGLNEEKKGTRARNRSNRYYHGWYTSDDDWDVDGDDWYAFDDGYYDNWWDLSGW